MNILVIAPGFFIPEHENGVNKILYNILKGPTPFKTDFMCLGENSEMSASLFPNVSVLENDAFERLEIPSKFAWARSWLPFGVYTQKSLRPLSQYIQDNYHKYDAIIVTTFSLSKVAEGLNFSITNKLHLLAIDSYSLFFKRRSEHDRDLIKKALWKLESLKGQSLEKATLPLFKSTLFVSKADQEYLKNLYPKASQSLVTIENGVQIPNVKKEDYAKKSNNILFVGNFGYAPNIEAVYFLVDQLLPLLVSENADIKLTLVGIDPQNFLDRFKQRPNLVIQGFVDDLAPYLIEADLFCCPLFFGAGIKNKVLEAMAYGLPILGSSYSFDGIDIDEYEYHMAIQSRDPKVWADHLFAILKESGLREKMGKWGREHMLHHFSWDSVRSRYYKQLLGVEIK